jgi:hypothetical protein
VIAPDGTVAHVIPKVTPKTHDDEVLAALELGWIPSRIRSDQEPAHHRRRGSSD